MTDVFPNSHLISHPKFDLAPAQIELTVGHLSKQPPNGKYVSGRPMSRCRGRGPISGGALSVRFFQYKKECNDTRDPEYLPPAGPPGKGVIVDNLDRLKNTTAAAFFAVLQPRTIALYCSEHP